MDKKEIFEKDYGIEMMENVKEEVVDMEFDKYLKLPDRIDEEELTSLFKKELVKYKTRKISKKDFLNIINILTDRQVMSYKLLDEEIKDKLDEVISDIWNVENYDEVDIILSIVINLGLQSCYEKIKNVVFDEIKDKNVLREIRETIKENGEDISNPYRSLEKYVWWREVKKNGIN